MSARFGWLLACACALVTTFAPQAALARSEIKLEADRSVVGVGQSFALTLQFVSDDDRSAQKPDLGPTPGFKVLGHSQGPLQSAVIVNGRASVQNGLIVTWTLRAEKVGRFTIGPAVVTVGTTKVKTAPVQVEVRKEAPPSNDPFGGFFRGFGEPERRTPDPADPKLALDAPRDEAIFLHATVDRKEAVVGEQITWTLDLYRDEDLGEPDFLEVKESACDDCLKQPLLANERLGALIGIAEIRGKRYEVKRERKLALFPMRTGSVRVSPMSLVLGTRGRPKRESEGFDLTITEPPLAGRPPGYTLGDTGQFDMHCEVSPRQVQVSGSVFANVALTGRGNFPSKLKTPVASAFAFASGDVKDAFDVDENDRLGGTRSFNYVVRLEEPGDVDLGAIRFPFYDPRAHTYRVAACDLGHVTVSGVKTPAAERAPILPPMPELRARLESPGRRTHLVDSPYLLGGCVAFPLGIALLATGERLRARRRAAKEARGPDLGARRAALRAAQGNDDRLKAARELLESATKARFDVGMRALSRSEATAALREAGAPDELAEQLPRLYEEGSRLRVAAESDAEVDAFIREVEEAV